MKINGMTYRKRILLPLLIVFITGGFFVGRADLFHDIAKSIETFTKVFKELNFNYVDEVNPNELMRAGLDGMLEALDPYTTYYDAREKGEIDLMTTGKYGGIGVTIGLRDGAATIVDVLEGYSAQRQGIIPGDIINSVNDIVINEANYNEISLMVKGEPGSFVSLSILRGTDTLKYELVRDEVIVKNVVFAGFVPDNGNTVYVKLAGFTRSAGAELQNALTALQREKEIKGIILDLRGNPGGLLESAVEISNLFLKKGQLIVTTRGKDPKSIREYVASREPLFPEVNLIVLVNEFSASASEIVAGAIQDHDRGVVLGNKTFGKGLVQTIIPISYNASLKLTTARYFTPSGRCIQKVDYGKDNKVIAVYLSLPEATFTTDNNRIVLSHGGVTPDTAVVPKAVSEVTQKILAKGLFFRFGTWYYNKNAQTKFADLNKNQVFSDFGSYLKESKASLDFEIDKKMKEVLTLTEDAGQYDQLRSAANAVLDQSGDRLDQMLRQNKEEVLKYLLTELATRFIGRDESVKVGLHYDTQFASAVSVLQKGELYNKILNKRK